MLNEYQLPEQMAMDKQRRLNYYVRLESESSLASEEDTESVNSIQDRETEFVQDTEDTDTEDTDTDSYIEYEVASLSDPDERASSKMSSDTDDIYVTEEVIAAVLGETSTETWGADGREDSCSSTADCEDFWKKDFWSCAECKSKNNDPRYRLCEKCFQVRKNIFPPRPKRYKKRKTESKKEAVNVDNLRSLLNGLSQDSGVGSSQEFPSLDFKEIKVPEQHLNKCGSTSSSSEISTASSSGLSSSSVKDDDSGYGKTASRKRKYSDSFSDDEVRPKKIIIEGSLNSKNESTRSLIKECTEDKTDLKELCIMCTLTKKDGIFLHGNSAHSCCCYKCALKTWKSTKRCPVCNRRVSNVVKLFTI